MDADDESPSVGGNLNLERQPTDPAGDLENVPVLISAIEHFSYCPRQCALIHVEQTFDENQYTIRGSQSHERVDSGVISGQQGIRTVRGMWLWSDRLGLQGKADAVEFGADGPYPVEYKVSRRRGPHADLQLCAQALCLEEMLGEPVQKGAIFEIGTRKRKEVRFDEHLRNRTDEVIAAIRQMLRQQAVPPAPNDSRCPKCSLLNACLPSVVGETARLRGLQGALFHPWNLGEDDA